MSGVNVRLEAKIITRMLNILKKENPGKWKEWNDCVKPNGTMMVQASKGWYGLCAASALWYNEVSKTLEESRYVKHQLDRCLFHKKDENGDMCYIMLHVDDMGVIMKPNSFEKIRLKNILEDKYEKLKAQDTDTVKYIGLEIHRNRENNRFELTMND